jgi:hypothetical protein
MRRLRILLGLVGLSLTGCVVAPARPVYYAPPPQAYYVAPPPVYYAPPPPVVVLPPPAPRPFFYNRPYGWAGQGYGGWGRGGYR